MWNFIQFQIVIRQPNINISFVKFQLVSCNSSKGNIKKDWIILYQKVSNALYNLSTKLTLLWCLICWWYIGFFNWDFKGCYLYLSCVHKCTIIIGSKWRNAHNLKRFDIDSLEKNKKGCYGWGDSIDTHSFLIYILKNIYKLTKDKTIKKKEG